MTVNLNHVQAKIIKHIRPNILDTFRYRTHPYSEQTLKLPQKIVTRRFYQTPDTLVQLASIVVDKLPLPDAFQWTNYEIVEWINKLGYPQYVETFRKNLINGRTLLLLDASALIIMNIKNIKDIQAITESIRKIYHIQLIRLTRIIRITPQHLDTYYKLYQVKTGGKYLNKRHTDFWRTFGFLHIQSNYEIHWQSLEKYLQHNKPNDYIIFGRSGQTTKYTDYRIKSNLPRSNSKCDMKMSVLMKINSQLSEEMNSQNSNDAMVIHGVTKVLTINREHKLNKY